MKRILLIGGGVLLSVVAVWAVAWHILADRLVARVEAWAEARRIEGLSAGHAGIAVAGFPFYWRVVVTKPTVAGGGAAGWLWHGDSLTAVLSPQAMGEVTLSFAGEHVLSAGEGALAGAWRVRAERPDGRLRLRQDDRLDQLELDFARATLTRLPEGAPVQVERLAAIAVLPPSTGADPRAETFIVTIKLDSISPVEPPLAALGTTINTVRLDLQAKGRLPPGRFSSAVAKWRDDGGTVEIANAAMRWGPIEAEGNGTVTLDAQNRPLGAFTARWRGYVETIDALQAAGQIQPWPAAGAKMALNALARQQPDGARQVEIPLSAQDGRLFIAGFPLIRLQPLKLE